MAMVLLGEGSSIAPGSAERLQDMRPDLPVFFLAAPLASAIEADLDQASVRVLIANHCGITPSIAVRPSFHIARDLTQLFCFPNGTSEDVAHAISNWVRAYAQCRFAWHSHEYALASMSSIHDPPALDSETSLAAKVASLCPEVPSSWLRQENETSAFLIDGRVAWYYSVEPDRHGKPAIRESLYDARRFLPETRTKVARAEKRLMLGESQGPLANLLEQDYGIDDWLSFFLLNPSVMP